MKFGTPCPTGADSVVELQTLYVQTHAIGRGVGKALLQVAEAQARERSGGSLWLTVNTMNARAIAFYTRQGYLKIGTAYFTLGSNSHENLVLVGREADPL